MISKLETFWIKFILRFAIGFLFLFAAMGQFSVGGAIPFEAAQKFSEQLSGGFKSTWMADISIPGTPYTGVDFARWFLYGLPFAFTILGFMILTGLGTKIALRVGALLLICLGLGKYTQGPEGITTTANDFLFALIICIGLFFYAIEKRQTMITSSPA